MGIIAIWMHLTEQSRASSTACNAQLVDGCMQCWGDPFHISVACGTMTPRELQALALLIAGDPYIQGVQRGGVETHGKLSVCTQHAPCVGPTSA